MFLLFLSFVLLLLYLYFTKNHDYWVKRNVKHNRPIPLFGNMFQNVIAKQSITEMTTELYKKYPGEKVVGFYHGTTPELIIRDLDLVRRILSVDFASFYPRGLGRNPKREPLFLNLFHVEGDIWRMLRHRLTPTFTTAKLKKMFPLILECADKLQHLGEEIVNKGGECDVRDLMARFTIEFIGACGFGFQLDTINNEHSEFRKFGKMLFDRNRSWKNIILVIMYDLIPGIGALLQTLLAETFIINTISDIVRTVRTQRNNKPSGRNDFIDLLLELDERGKITGESIEKRKSDGSAVQVEMEMDFNCMVAQVFVFFGAGFETSSSATSYTLHQLAFNPEKQRIVQNEIDQVLEKHGNKMSYDSINEMRLLRMAFKEALRMFPSLGTLHKVCAKRYTIPELDLTIDPGVKITIPVQAIHNDEKYFENPEEFKPERFANESGIQNNYSYMPFGEGPRMCIGARLGEMQSLAGLAAVLQKFSVEPAPSTKRNIEVNHTSNVVQSVQGGLPLKLRLRIQ